MKAGGPAPTSKIVRQAGDDIRVGRHAQDARIGLMLYGHRPAPKNDGHRAGIARSVWTRCTIAQDEWPGQTREARTPIAKGAEQAGRRFRRVQGPAELIVMVTTKTRNAAASHATSAEALKQARTGRAASTWRIRHGR